MTIRKHSCIQYKDILLPNFVNLALLVFKLRVFMWTNKAVLSTLKGMRRLLPSDIIPFYPIRNATKVVRLLQLCALCVKRKRRA